MSEKKSYLEGKKILAVDDDEDILEIIKEELETADVDTAQDYQTASEKISQKKYDLAILDIMGVNGLNLLVEAVNKGIPTVMLTAHALNPETLETSIKKGALSFLPKEELPNLDEFLSEILVTEKKGGSTWKLLFDRLGNFFEHRFGKNWMDDHPEIGRRYGKPGRWHEQG
jgi:DNA-binding NtrC family response regulator